MSKVLNIGIIGAGKVGATIATDEVANSWTGVSISTFGGNPVSMAASLATLVVIEEEDLKTNARVVGGYLREKLETNPAKPQLLVTEPGVGYRLVLND